MSGKLWALVALLLSMLLTISACASAATADKNTQSQAPGKLNLEAVNQLLDVLDTLAGRNPSAQAFADWAKTAGERKAADSALTLAMKNAHDPRVQEMIDALLTTDAYRLYYAQFRNISQPTHHDILCALPYRAIDSPAGIADNLLEIFSNRALVRKWAHDVIAKIDLTRCNAIASEWAPQGDHSTPTVYFVYDGNGGAFARNGAVCVDLFGMILGTRPAATRFAGLSEISIDDMERVLAHEFVHIYSAPSLMATLGNATTWQDKMIDRITVGLVDEGIALQCNPPENFKADLWNDTATVAFWIKQLGDRLAVLKAGEGNPDATSRWWSSTYQELPESLLVNYLSRRYPKGDQAKLRAQYMSDRPDLEHMLGWWMVSKIYVKGRQKEKVMQLLSAPDKLFPLYNEAMKDAPPNLRLSM
jgi:hypothetical protein